ncbi:MAG: hypothetical protein ACLR76_09515 [Alistipes sp.]
MIESDGTCRHFARRARPAGARGTRRVSEPRVQEIARPARMARGRRAGRADELLLVGMVHAGRVPGLSAACRFGERAMPSAWSATATGRMKTRYRSWSG